MPMDCSIIVIDDEQDFLDSVRRGFITSGLRNVQTVRAPEQAADLFDAGKSFDIALIDVTMPKISGPDLLAHILKKSPGTMCIMVTAVNDARLAVSCIKTGAFDYLVKPVSREDLVTAVKRAIELKRLREIPDVRQDNPDRGLKHPQAFKAMDTQTPELLRILKEAELHAASNVPILITGESGTGKELLARAVHNASQRKASPFTPVNMAAVSASLFDAEFFGHVKGAFTGADDSRAGYIETTCGGTLFLDEIGYLGMELQGKLLRIFQEGEFYKLGDSRLRKVDVRFIAATNVDIEKMVEKGEFRPDLYYRMKGARLHLPSLKRRKEDIPLLVDAILAEAYETGQHPGIEDNALNALMAYEFPGNIRELKSILLAAVNLAPGKPVDVNHFPENIRRPSAVPPESAQAQALADISSLQQIEKAHILKVYHQTQRNKSQTARLLNIGLNTLRRKLESYGVD